MNYFIEYANAGFSVLPIATDGTKRPILQSWKKYQEAIAPADELQYWHEMGWGIGIVGGSASGGLEVIDIDDPSLTHPFCKAIHEADELLVNKLAFVETPRRDPETKKAGAHIYFRSASPAGSQKLALTEPLPVFCEDGSPAISQITKEQIYKPETLIETRGEGGYVLAPGCSPDCHPSGNTYEHVLGADIVDLELITASERETLFRIARTFDRSIVVQHRDPAKDDKDTPGNRFAAATSWDEILTPYGWVRGGENSNVTRWCRPGKDRGVSATTGLVSKAGTELLCVFSSNAHPFPGPTTEGLCSTHGKFDAFARLNFNGDHSKAAKYLCAKGFGTEQKKDPKDEKPNVFMTWRQAAEKYTNLIENGGGETLNTGLECFDKAVGGVAHGEVVIIGGRPSHGKTLLALQFANNFASDGHKVLVVSEEMSLMMLGKRRLQLSSDIPEMDWPIDIQKLKQDHSDMCEGQADVFISPPCGTVEKAIAAIETAATEHGIRIAAVDYAQLLRGKGESRYEQVTDVSQRLREAASKHGLLLLLVCQLNRGSERASSRPRSLDLRDSGQLEQDADVVALVDWPHRRSVLDCTPLDYAIYIDKNRNRETKAAKVECKINPSRQRIEELGIVWNPDPHGYTQFTDGD